MKDSVMLALICLAIVAASATFQPPRQVISFDSRYRLLQTCPSQPAFRTPSLVGSVRPMFRAQLRSSNESPEGVGNSPSGIDARIADVEKQIGQVEAQIIKVEGQIEEAGERAENASTEREMERWWKEKEDLRKKEEDLRKEKEDLRKEKEDLRKERMMLLEAQIASTTKPEGGPLAPKDSYEAFVTGLLDRFESLPGPQRLFATIRDFDFVEHDNGPFLDMLEELKKNQARYGDERTENRLLCPIAMVAGTSGCGKSRNEEECVTWMRQWLETTEIEGKVGGELLVIPINYNGGNKVNGLDDESLFYKLHMTSPAKAFRWRVVRAIFHPSMSLEEFGRTVYQPGLELDLVDLVKRVTAKYGKTAVLFLVDELLLSLGELAQLEILEGNGDTSKQTNLLSDIATVVQNLNGQVLTALVASSLTPKVRDKLKTGSGRDVVPLFTPSLSMAAMEAVTTKALGTKAIPLRVKDLLAVTGGHPRTLFEHCLPALQGRRAAILSKNDGEIKQAVAEVYRAMTDKAIRLTPVLTENQTKEFLTFGHLKNDPSSLNGPDSSSIGACMSRQDRFVARGALREHVVDGTIITTIPSICLKQVLDKCVDVWVADLKKALARERIAEASRDGNQGEGGEEFQLAVTKYLRARCLSSKGNWLSFKQLFGNTDNYREAKVPLDLDSKEFQMPNRTTSVERMKEADSNLLMSSFVESCNKREVGIEGTFPLRGNDQRVYLIALQCKWRKAFSRSAVEEARSKMKQAVDGLQDRVDCQIIPLYIINRLGKVEANFDYGDPEGPEIWVHGQGAVAEMFPLLVNSIRWGKYLED